MDNLTAHKTLIHALLCSPEGKCDRPDCTADVHKMKQKLKSMEAHAAECKIGANLPGRRGGCQTCKRWLQLQKLRDRFTRQLLQAASGRTCKTKAPASGGDGRPPLLKRSVTYIVNSFDDEDDEGDGIDLSLLPSLVEGELQGRKKRREAKKGGGGGSSSSKGDQRVCEPAYVEEEEEEEEGVRLCGLDGCTKEAWHTGTCLVELSGGRSRKRVREEEAAAKEKEEVVPAYRSAGAKPSAKPTSSSSSSSSSKPNDAKKAKNKGEAEEEGKPAAKGKGKAKAKAAEDEDDDDDEAQLQRMIVDGARLAQTPIFKGRKPRWGKVGGAGGGGGGGGGSGVALPKGKGSKKGKEDGIVTEDLEGTCILRGGSHTIPASPPSVCVCVHSQHSQCHSL